MKGYLMKGWIVMERELPKFKSGYLWRLHMGGYTIDDDDAPWDDCETCGDCDWNLGKVDTVDDYIYLRLEEAYEDASEDLIADYTAKPVDPANLSDEEELEGDREDLYRIFYDDNRDSFGTPHPTKTFEYAEITKERIYQQAGKLVEYVKAHPDE